MVTKKEGEVQVSAYVCQIMADYEALAQKFGGDVGMKLLGLAVERDVAMEQAFRGVPA